MVPVGPAVGIGITAPEIGDNGNDVVWLAAKPPTPPCPLGYGLWCPLWWIEFCDEWCEWCDDVTGTGAEFWPIIGGKITDNTAPPLAAGCTWMSAGTTPHNLEFDCNTEFRRISDWELILFMDSDADVEIIILGWCSAFLAGEAGPE